MISSPATVASFAAETSFLHEVVAHEFAHGISNSSISGFPGCYIDASENCALSESFSDAIGIAVKRANKQEIQQAWIDVDWLASLLAMTA